MKAQNIYGYKLPANNDEARAVIYINKRYVDTAQAVAWQIKLESDAKILNSLNVKNT